MNLHPNCTFICPKQLSLPEKVEMTNPGRSGCSGGVARRLKHGAGAFCFIAPPHRAQGWLGYGEAPVLTLFTFQVVDFSHFLRIAIRIIVRFNVFSQSRGGEVGVNARLVIRKILPLPSVAGQAIVAERLKMGLAMMHLAPGPSP